VRAYCARTEPSVALPSVAFLSGIEDQGGGEDWTEALCVAPSTAGGGPSPWMAGRWCERCLLASRRLLCLPNPSYRRPRKRWRVRDRAPSVRASSCPSFASCCRRDEPACCIPNEKETQQAELRRLAFLLSPPSCFCRRARAHVGVCSEWCDPTELFEVYAVRRLSPTSRRNRMVVAPACSAFWAGHQRTNIIL
jgi:hypothetical protein